MWRQVTNKTMPPDSRVKGYVTYFDNKRETNLRETMIRENSTKQKTSGSAKGFSGSAQILKLKTSCKTLFFIWKLDHEQMQTTDRELSREDDSC